MASKPPAKRPSTRRPSRSGLSVEGAWRCVDRLCRAVWPRHHDDPPPQSLADLITTLRDEEVIPANEANMMHTIRSLRNLVVHESLEAGDHETTVAQAAWANVERWAQKQERQAWKAASAACSDRE